MKKRNILLAGLFCASIVSSCKIGGLELQKNYEYQPGSTVDPKINKTALQYLRERGKAPLIANDTVFKYMQLGLEYAGIDPTEYEKAGRTFIFLGNNAVRVLPTTTTAGVVKTTSNIPTAGFWFDFPIMEKNPDGTQKYAADGVTPVTHPATSWNEYSPQTLKNYFLYLIGVGDLGFNNLNSVNQSLPTLLPAGATAGKESRLGYLVVNAAPNLSLSGTRTLTFDFTGTNGKGFDLEGKFNLKQNNADFSPMVMNDGTTVVTGGIIATNGQIHVTNTLTVPSRY
ncbi:MULTISPECIES: hypothetical protein [unclassified Mucilaginibacter]|uniref:hypothetical protein n=1 Tax=unclassified Mucilaginibacter TaxID=2617802 RepID=UPI0031F69A07